ncbi:MAG: tetratricopeptide repeat protein [Pirellulales bacterium]|nr:tetratricopeptide repeat protein [Pirellulales bacterium]
MADNLPTFSALHRAYLPLLAVVLLTGCQGFTNLQWNDHPLASEKSGIKPAKQNTKQAAAYDLDLAKAENFESESNLEAARAVYQRLIAQQPKRYEAYHRLGVLADRQRRYREAETLYGQAIRLRGGDAGLFNDLGYCLYLQGKFDKAEGALLKAVSYDPSNSRYRNNLGMVYGNQKRYDEALAQFRRAGSDADAYYNLAFILASNEDPEGAKNCFRLALAADSTHEPSRRALESFERYERDPERRAGTDPVADDGVNWVAYEEDAQRATPADPAVRPATHEAPVPRTRPSIHQSSRADRQALLDRARAIATSPEMGAGQ